MILLTAMGRALRVTVLSMLASAALASPPAPASVPAPFEPVRAIAVGGAVEVGLWGRSYRFEAGPLPVRVRSQGVLLLAEPPRVSATVGAQAAGVAWQPSRLVEERPDLVRLHTSGTLPGIRIEAETRIEYDGMVAVDLALHAEARATLSRVEYELPLAGDAMRYYAHHLPYDYQVANVDKRRLLEAAGALPDRLALDFTPTLALGDRRVGVEWWSETNAHWAVREGEPGFSVEREGAVVRLRITPVASPLVLLPGAVWRDAFALFVFPARPPPERWRAVRMLPYPRAAGFDRTIGTRFLSLAMQASFHARYDGLPGSEGGAFQTEVRAAHARYGVGYMPYGMLTLAPILHPLTMINLDAWSAEGRWWRLQPGFDNATIRRTHPELGPGAPYTYPACAGRADYFDFIREQNLAALRAERLDALYFDHGSITRMCVRSPRLAGRPGRETWEYGNVRAFYKRLYEEVHALSMGALVVIHTHGAPKALGAFADFHLFGEALNGVFGGGRPVAAYSDDPRLYTPDYLALPEGWLDAQLFPPVGGVASLLPQVRPASTPDDPARVRGFQRAFQALVLANDAHAPLWVSDAETVDAIYHAVDRFGEIGDAVVHPWWSNEAIVRRPANLRATLWVRDGKALLVLANLGAVAVEGEVTIDAGALGLPGLGSVRDLEVPAAAAAPLVGAGFRVAVPPRDLRLMLLTAGPVRRP